MFELSIYVNFEAAHCLPDYPGKCRRLHGHNWRVEVSIEGSKLNDLGMLMDFSILKMEVMTVINVLDHQYLNEIYPFNEINPTAENIAKYIYEQLAAKSIFQSNPRLLAVKVWESPNSAVIYREV